MCVVAAGIKFVLRAKLLLISGESSVSVRGEMLSRFDTSLIFMMGRTNEASLNHFRNSCLGRIIINGRA